MPKSLTLPKKCRLLKNKEFRAVLAGKNRRSDHLLVVHMLANGLDYTRIGVSVGRAQGNSVARNRIKRLIREAASQGARLIALPELTEDRLAWTSLEAAYDVLGRVLDKAGEGERAEEAKERAEGMRVRIPASAGNPWQL